MLSSTGAALEGTFEHNGHVYSSLVGELESSHANGMVSLSVRRPNLVRMPGPGSIIFGRAVRVSDLDVRVHIVLVGDQPAPENCQGLLKSKDSGANTVRTMFRPGDTIRAKILALGEHALYYLTTADPDLGVVFSKHSESREFMIPISPTEMKCPATGTTESRKVARLHS